MALSPQAKDSAEFDKNIAQWQEQMNRMQAQMDQLRQTQDPKERQKLLDEHWATMQTAMSIMRGMWGPGMMGPGMMGGAGQGWGHMGGYYSHMTPGQLRQRQYMTDQYLRMQQENEQHDVAATVPDGTAACRNAINVVTSNNASATWGF